MAFENIYRSLGVTFNAAVNQMISRSVNLIAVTSYMRMTLEIVDNSTIYWIF